MLNKLSTFLIATVLSTSGAIGQSTFGGIVGVVKDPSQGEVAGAQVMLTSLEDGNQRSATTDGNGAFEFVNLKPPATNWSFTETVSLTTKLLPFR
jgi:hypothetical protein